MHTLDDGLDRCLRPLHPSTICVAMPFIIKGPWFSGSYVAFPTTKNRNLENKKAKDKS